MNKKVLVIVAHPYLNRSVANKFITDHIKNIPNVTIHDLYEEYPYFNIDVKKEQSRLAQYGLIIFQHPFFWYNMPPLLKLWIDDVLELGFAHGPNGEALKGKDFLLSITTGGSSSAYSPEGTHRHLVNHFLFGYEQISFLCGMNWNSPHILHSSRNSADGHLYAHSEGLKRKISNYLEKGAV